MLTLKWLLNWEFTVRYNYHEYMHGSYTFSGVGTGWGGEHCPPIMAESWPPIIAIYTYKKTDNLNLTEIAQEFIERNDRWKETFY